MIVHSSSNFNKSKASQAGFLSVLDKISTFLTPKSLKLFELNHSNVDFNVKVIIYSTQLKYASQVWLMSNKMSCVGLECKIKPGTCNHDVEWRKFKHLGPDLQRSKKHRVLNCVCTLTYCMFCWFMFCGWSTKNHCATDNRCKHGGGGGI